jgi:threonine dehydrogenase-like Zn-dependent dehydrogenase
MLSTYFLRLDGFEVWVAGRSAPPTPKSELAEACGARYVSTKETPLATLTAETGGFDVVIEAAGDAQVMLDTLGLLRRNGVACLLGVDGSRRKVELDGPVLGVDTILQNRALLGSVNAHARDWEDAVERLDRARDRWPDALEQFVGLRVPVDRFAEAFGFRGVKATLRFAAG